MKKLAIILSLFIFTGISASISYNNPKPTVEIYETEFSRGWREGYINGWCYNRPNCITPIVPITPNPNFLQGESYENYTAGYNRGFVRGKSDRENRRY
jgi:hypothetical protein